MQRIIPNLWFDTQAEAAAEFYTSIFPNSKITEATHYLEAGPGPEGSVLTVNFLLDGQAFTAINGGPHDDFNDAISLLVSCDSQEEIDYFWDQLGDGGREVQCGWLKDRYGVSWQIVPSLLDEMITSDDRDAANRAMQAMLRMVKLDVNELRAAFEGP